MCKLPAMCVLFFGFHSDSFMTRLKMYGQIALLCEFSLSLIASIHSCTDWICLAKLLSCVAWWPQWLQIYLTPSCTDWICLVKLPSSVNCFPHWSQAYFTPSCWDWIWYELSDYPAVKIVCHTDYKYIWILHVLTFFIKTYFSLIVDK